MRTIREIQYEIDTCNRELHIHIMKQANADERISSLDRQLIRLTNELQRAQQEVL